LLNQKGQIMKILLVAGARPNFMKIAPLIKEMNRQGDCHPFLVHTGQHYDSSMSGQFFADLEIPPPDISLDVGSGSHAVQTAEVMKRLEPVLDRERPDMVLVVGDVNSTVAAALTAVKMHIPVAHVEAGLRSFDRTMPEEINRLVTDAISDWLFVTEESGVTNLLAEGVSPNKVFLVGNVMIDCLQASRRSWERSRIREALGLVPGQYGVITLHRPSNVDDPDTLSALLGALGELAQQLPMVFPVHPRTRGKLEALATKPDNLRMSGGGVSGSGIYCTDPLGYLDFMALVSGARIILTDSGGIQEETTALGIPCVTLRENTERPITVSHGTNRIVGTSPSAIAAEGQRILNSIMPPPPPPPLWDGHAAERIVHILRQCVGRLDGSRVTGRA
jgi:UDP-N-acetylglucosamine 2-epimerase (non-hydrolysing)